MNPNLTQLLIERMSLPSDWLAEDVMEYLEQLLVEEEWPVRDNPLWVDLDQKEGSQVSFERAFQERKRVLRKAVQDDDP